MLRQTQQQVLITLLLPAVAALPIKLLVAVAVVVVY
jgi:hypothetical protein